MDATKEVDRMVAEERWFIQEDIDQVIGHELHVWPLSFRQQKLIKGVNYWIKLQVSKSPNSAMFYQAKIFKPKMGWQLYEGIRRGIGRHDPIMIW